MISMQRLLGLGYLGDIVPGVNRAEFLADPFASKYARLTAEQRRILLYGPTGSIEYATGPVDTQAFINAAQYTPEESKIFIATQIEGGVPASTFGLSQSQGIALVNDLNVFRAQSRLTSQPLSSGTKAPIGWYDDLYLLFNPDIQAWIASGNGSAYDHWLQFGQKEGRNSGFIPSDWNEAYYLKQNPDVAAWVQAGHGSSGYYHWVVYGQNEGRTSGFGVSTPTGDISKPVSFKFENTTSGNTSVMKTGETWRITITGTMGGKIQIMGGKNGGTGTTDFGTIPQNGTLVKTGTPQSGDIGNWSLTFYLNGQPIGMLAFSVIDTNGVQSPTDQEPQGVDTSNLIGGNGLSIGGFDLSSKVSIAGHEVPVWMLAAGGIGAYFFMKGR